jgi:uncharacterized membrane protein YvlD (DUF360 family)
MDKFLIKCVINGIIAVPLLLWFTIAGFWEVVIAALALCVVSYIIGDRMILPATNNTVATISDFGLAYAFFWAVGSIMNWNLTLGEVFWVALGVTAVEMWFHTTLPQGDRRRANSY